LEAGYSAAFGQRKGRRAELPVASRAGLGEIERMILRVLLVLLLGFAGVAQAREDLGIFAGWGAFRDEARGRCYAIAETARRVRGGGRGYVTVTRWPARNLRGQIYFRLTRRIARGTPIVLGIGDRRIPLIAGGTNAWAPDERTDRAIVSAMRWGSSMSVEAMGEDGRPIADTYRLRGAASAIDAAAVACLAGAAGAGRRGNP
jgi:hypothetical protein